MTASEPFDLTDFDPDESAYPMDSTPVTVRGLAELRTSIPYLLGFYPERSLVAIGLQYDGSVLLTLRIDAPQTVAQAIAVVEEIVPVLQRGCPERVVVAYCDDYELGDTAATEREQVTLSSLRAYETVRELAPVLARELAASGLSVMFVWPERPGMPRREGGPVPEIAVAQVLSGRRLLRNRSEVGARLEPASGAVRRRVRDHIAELERVPHSRMDLVAMVTDILERQASALAAGRSPAATEPHDAAICAIAMRDITTRDILITVIAQERSWCQDDHWCRVTQLVPTEYVAPVATMAAVTAYLGGDGALARCAFDRALRHDPDYSLAQMIDASLRAGLHPEQLRAILASTFDPIDAGDENGP
jgi:hypothetical protein